MASPTGDVKLVPLAPEHAERMLSWVADPDVAIDLGLRKEPTLERTLAFIERSRTDPTVRPFAVLRRGEHVGNAVLDEIDEKLASARLSIYLGVRGEGVGTKAVQELLHIAFKEMSLNRVWLTVHVRNAAAIAVYRKAGFRDEGLLREAFLLGSERVDARLMAILARDLP